MRLFKSCNETNKSQHPVLLKCACEMTQIFKCKKENRNNCTENTGVTVQNVVAWHLGTLALQTTVRMLTTGPGLEARTSLIRAVNHCGRGR
jgi:hypothetical protein